MIYTNKIYSTSQDLFYDILKRLKVTPITGNAKFFADGIETPIVNSPLSIVDRYIEKCIAKGVIPFGIQNVQYDPSGLIITNRRIAFKEHEDPILETIVAGGRDAEINIDLRNGFNYFKGRHISLLKQGGYEVSKAYLLLSMDNGKPPSNNMEISLSNKNGFVELKIKDFDKSALQRNVKDWFSNLKAKYDP